MKDKIVSLLFCFVLLNQLHGNTLQEKINQLSLSERIQMRAFFDYIIKRDQAAHVLFFPTKPACIAGPVLKYPQKSFIDVLSLKGWRAFKRNEPLFPHPDFIFNENVVNFGKDVKVLHIYVINKKTLKQVLEQQLSVFKESLGEQFEADWFIQQLESGHSLPSLINHDEMLLGILLGYGVESARAFKEVKPLCEETVAPPLTDTYRRIDLQCPKACKISPVVFMGNPYSEEVQQLSQRYEEELLNFWSLYKRAEDPLRMVLEKICAQN